MKRALTKREKILMLILAVLMIGIGYYKLVLSPINTQIEVYEGMAMEEQISLDTNTVRAAVMARMERETEQAKKSGKNWVIPAYDNREALMETLNRLFASCSSYALDFGEEEKDGIVVKKPVQITYETGSYREVRDIIDRLYDCGYAMQVAEVTLQAREATDRNLVTAYMNVTFFEANGK